MPEGIGCLSPVKASHPVNTKKPQKGVMTHSKFFFIIRSPKCFVSDSKFVLETFFNNAIQKTEKFSTSDLAIQGPACVNQDSQLLTQYRSIPFELAHLTSLSQYPQLPE